LRPSKGGGRRRGGVTPFALSAVLILISATLLGVYVAHREVERERRERREGELSLAEDKVEEAFREASEALKGWMEGAAEAHPLSPERALEVVEEGGEEVFAEAVGQRGVRVEALELSFTEESSLLNVTGEGGEEVPIPAEDFFVATGTCTLSVPLTGGGHYSRDKLIEVRCPRPGAYTEVAARQVEGSTEEIESLLSYVLTTLGEMKVLGGEGVEDSVEGSAFGEGEVRRAASTVLALYLSSRVRSISPSAFEDMAYIVCGRRGEGERVASLLKALRGKDVDPAAFYLNLTGLSERWLDPSALLAGALYALADQLFLKYLEYLGVLPSIQKVLEFLREVGEEVLEALQKVSSFFKRIFTGEEEDPSVEYLRHILVESAHLEESYFLRFMVEDRSGSRYATYSGEPISSWPEVDLSGHSGEEELAVALTSTDTSTWIYEGGEVTGYTQRVYHLAFTLQGSVEFPFREVNVIKEGDVSDLLDYMEEREETSLSQLFMQMLRAVVEGVLDSPSLKAAMEPFLYPPKMDPTGEEPLEVMLGRAREVMESLLLKARDYEGNVWEEAARFLAALSGGLDDVVSYLRDRYDGLVGREQQILWSSSEVISALTSSNVKIVLLSSEERVVNSLSDSDQIVDGPFPELPPKSTVLTVALNGGTHQSSIREEIHSWLEDAALEAYLQVREREVGEGPDGVITQAVYASLGTSSVAEVLNIFFGGEGVGESLLQLASSYALASLDDALMSLQEMNLTSRVHIPSEEHFNIVAELEGYPPVKPVVVSLEGLSIAVEVADLEESGLHATDPGRTSENPFSVKGSYRISARVRMRTEEVTPFRPGGYIAEREISINLSGGYFFLGPYPISGVKYASSRELGEDLWQLIKDFFSYVWGKIKGPLKVLWGHIKRALSRVMKYVEKIIQGAREVIDLLNRVINGVIDTVKDLLGKLLEEASESIVEYLGGSSGEVNIRLDVLSFTFLISARSPARVPSGGYILNLTLLRGSLNTTFHLRKLPGNPAAPFISFRYREGRSDLKALIDPLEIEGPLYHLEGPLFIGDHGGFLELEGTVPVVYRRASIALSDILKRKPTVPIPPLGVVASIDLGVRMDYLMPPETGLYLNEYGVKEGSGWDEGWVELYNPTEQPLDGFTLLAGGRRVRLMDGGETFPVFKLEMLLGVGDTIELRDENGTLVDSFTLPGDGGFSRLVDGVGRWSRLGESRGESNSGGAESLKGVIVGIVLRAIRDAWDDSWESYGMSFKTLKEFASLSFRYVKERVLEAIEDLILKIYFYFEIFVKEATGSEGVGAVVSVGIDGEGLSSLLEWLGKTIKRVFDRLLGRPETSPPPTLPQEVLSGTWLTIGVALESSSPGGVKAGTTRRILLSLSLNVPALKKLLRMSGTGGWEVRFGALIPSLNEEEAERWGVDVGEDEVADLYFLKGSFRRWTG